MSRKFNSVNRNFNSVNVVFFKLFLLRLAYGWPKSDVAGEETASQFLADFWPMNHWRCSK